MHARASALRFALAAALLTLAAAPEALATCGDYLQMDEQHSPTSSSENRGTDSQPEVPCGCPGAECQGAPLAPLAPHAPARSLLQQDGNLLPFADKFLESSGSWTRLELAERPNRGYPLPLNRPPDVLA